MNAYPSHGNAAREGPFQLDLGISSSGRTLPTFMGTTFNSSDHPDIQYADSEDASPPAVQGEVVKPERPPKPERLSHPSGNGSVESNNNNNTSSSKPEAITGEEEVFTQPINVGGTLPRPAPRPQPPVPPIKPRSTISTSSIGAVGDSTDL